ncbi:choice-of-anchor B family protein [Rubrivivax albus]|nr:choice-of-anchor B family protein [Rubrivivax albus]
MTRSTLARAGLGRPGVRGPRAVLGMAAVLAMLGAGAPAAHAHSAMFPDGFRFDDSNEGPSAAQLRQQRPANAPAGVCAGGQADGYPCSKVDLRAFVPKASLGGGTQNLNDIWGWTDPLTGAEIAIVGRTHGTAFVDISVPTAPVLLGFLPSHNGGSDAWRDIKVYADHAFIVADGGGNASHGLQVFDLRTLRGLPPGGTLSETAHLGTFGPAHNIAINEDTGYAYVVGSNRCSGGLYMVDVSSPQAPAFAGCFSADGYTHDTQCVVYAGPDAAYAGREICVAYNEDTVTVVDVTNKANPQMLSRTPYAGVRYTHQGWFLDGSHDTIIVNDELDESSNGHNTRSYLFDLSDLDRPVEIGRYTGPTPAIDHNLYTRDGYVFETNYRAGLRILDASAARSGTLTEVAYFDTIPGSDAPQFSGTWSSYVWFGSGNVVLSDIGGGLFVVAPDWDAIGGGGGGSSFENTTPVAIPDRNLAGATSAIAVTRSGQAGTVEVTVDITHPAIGQLIVDLISPAGTVRNLHNRTGGSTDNLQQTYTVDAGTEAAEGTWQLRVRDIRRRQTGTLHGWRIRFP